MNVQKREVIIVHKYLFKYAKNKNYQDILITEGFTIVNQALKELRGLQKID